jgi:hypothetical protein
MAEAGTEQLHEELIIERFKKIRLSDVSAEFLLLLERSRADEKRGSQRSHSYMQAGVEAAARVAEGH